ncbi:hypothetical protein UP09_14275 [Bradyrhizobium sp. LTSP885]|uniref:hypothetical protein n=1 Tax=Bradyrhizobium sp. LTSP885 TaxID=1619232 RepID=UPI0005CB3312|nr:hypothetical protein [Bradyrhizobium sp. LTSP885]KJC44813.1 hypothetical protein UP09_14275 [Bradyrhizobium sp. LTSP885]
MKTESANALSQLFEIDRATMLRALRTTPPDAGDGSRPTWKVSTAANALAAHRASVARVDSRQHLNRNGTASADTNYQDPLLVQLHAQFDEANARLRTLPTLEARRRAAIDMVPVIGRVDAALRERGRLNGLDADAVDLRADSLYALQLRKFEAPCQWTIAEVWAAMAERVGA